jgi:hypothetical protein
MEYDPEGGRGGSDGNSGSAGGECDDDVNIVLQEVVLSNFVIPFLLRGGELHTDHFSNPQT